MKFELTPLFPGKCIVKLIPETPEEKAITDPDIFQAYFQIGINRQFGPKAHLMSVDEMEIGFEMTANYIMERSRLSDPEF
jgi:hypothetical protein